MNTTLTCHDGMEISAGKSGFDSTITMSFDSGPGLFMVRLRLPEALALADILLHEANGQPADKPANIWPFSATPTGAQP